MAFYLKRSFAALTPAFFSRCTKLYLATSWLCNLSIPLHPIQRRRGIGKDAETRSEVCEGASACPIWSYSPSFPSADPWRSDIQVKDHPWSFSISIEPFFTYPTLSGLCGHAYTVRLLTHVLCKPTHFFFHLFIATMSYSLQTSFYSVMKDWADKYHVWDAPTRSPSRLNSR